jgi:hypothetical protein
MSLTLGREGGITLITINLDLVLLQVILNLEDNKLFNVMLVHKVTKLMMARLQ